MKTKKLMQWSMMVVLAAGLAGCQSAYYGAMEKVGVHKRDIMTDRVKDARTSQEEAKQAFQSALEQFTSVVKVDGGDLEKTYKRLNKSYENAATRADEVKSRIGSIESVSQALFKEWKSEIKTYSSPELRKQSEAQLKSSQVRYEQMIKAMKTAASKMDPVLMTFRDQVMFLKHNLNSAAIASIQGEVVKVQADVARLIADMEKAIAEADAFISNMPAGGG